MAASGLVAHEQDLAVHLFAPMDGPHAADARARIRDLWSECRASLGMTEPIPLDGLSDRIPDDFSVLPDFAVIAGQQSPDAIFQAVLRRNHDVLNLSLLIAGAQDRGASPPLWPELDQMWSALAKAGTGFLIGSVVLYLAKVDGAPGPQGPAADWDEVGEMLGALVPPAPPAVGWRRTRLSTSAGVTAWEISARDDLRAERRFVVAARPETKRELSAWTWSRGDAAMPPLARYLMHTAKIRYELRVLSGATRASALCQDADQGVAEIRALLGDVASGGAAQAQQSRKLLPGRISALRHDVVRMTELSMAAAAMRQTVEIAESNAAQALGGDLPASGGPDFISDDHAVATLLCQRLDDEVRYLRASTDGARQVIEFADVRQAPDPARDVTAARLPEGGSLGRAVVLSALPLELLAMREHLTDVQVIEHARGTRFDTGELPDSGWQVSLAGTGPGNVGAGIIAERAITLFDPDVLLFVGIAGSLEDDIKVGDIVVATRVDAYSGGMAAKDFLARPQTWPISYRLLQLAQRLERDGGWQALLPAQPGGGVPAVQFRPIAAGEVVLVSHDSALFKQLRLYYNDVAAIAMEDAGVAQAAYLNDSLPVLVIRGISDPSDRTKLKNDRQGGQQRAAANAASFAAFLLKNMKPPSRPDRS